VTVAKADVSSSISCLIVRLSANAVLVSANLDRANASAGAAIIQSTMCAYERPTPAIKPANVLIVPSKRDFVM
jgi:hypothetical protein